MSRQLTTMGLNMLSRRSSLLLCVPSKTIVRRLLSNVAQQPVVRESSIEGGREGKGARGGEREGEGGMEYVHMKSASPMLCMMPPAHAPTRLLSSLHLSLSLYHRAKAPPKAPGSR